MKKFKVTPKDAAENDRGKAFLYLIPFALLVVLSVIGIFNCVRNIFESNSLGPVLVIFWLIVNLYSLVMSMFFVSGRNLRRSSERNRLDADCLVRQGEAEYICQAADISEAGIALYCSTPICLDAAGIFTIRVSNSHYTANVEGRVVYVCENSRVWKYAFQITDYLGSYDEYLQLVYDRVPTLPQNLSNSSSSFDDLRINLFRRVKKSAFEKRRCPRMVMGLDVPDENGTPYHMVDFDYRYCTLWGKDLAPELRLTLSPAIKLYCRMERKTSDGCALYQITNHRILHDDPALRKELESWAGQNWSRDRVSRPDEKASAAGSESKAAFEEMNYV